MGQICLEESGDQPKHAMGSSTARAEPVSPPVGTPNGHLRVKHVRHQAGAPVAMRRAQPDIDPVRADENRDKPNRDTELLDRANVSARGQGGEPDSPAANLEGAVANVWWR